MKTYAFKYPSGKVGITNLDESGGNTMENVLTQLGFPGTAFIDITGVALPARPQEFWDIQNGAIVLNQSDAAIQAVLDGRRKMTPLKFLNAFHNTFPTATPAETFLAKIVSMLIINIGEKDIS